MDYRVGVGNVVSSISFRNDPDYQPLTDLASFHFLPKPLAVYNLLIIKRLQCRFIESMQG